MSIWIPVTVTHVCGSLSARTRLHAIHIDTATKANGSGRFRTLCGSDVPKLHGATMPDGSSVVMPWPPPKEHRCEDCTNVIGGRPPADGHEWWGRTEAAA